MLAGCNSGEVSLPAPKQSNDRSTSDGSDFSDSDGGSEGTDPDSSYCRAVKDLGATDDEASSDPAKAIELLTELGKVAPSELKKPFDTLGGVVGDLAALDEDNPDDFAKAFEIIMDPQIQAAVTQIDSLTIEMCGVDLSGGGSLGDEFGSDDLPSTTVDDSSGTKSSTDLDLEHIDQVKEANSGAAWVKLLSSSMIMNDTDVTLAASSTDPIQLADALEACVAVRQSLVQRNPDVTVTISNDETPIVKAPANGECTAV